ncbi:DEAD/DEAH box helicase [Pyrobaculum sp.]|uniref:DEAD/DEAH box helicase n=1 Tax=Pyrobaculum sp. TaxID=2004705 RepID=UPI003D144605
MRLRIATRESVIEREVEWEVARLVIEELKKWRARFEPEGKTWRVEHLPCPVAKMLGAKAECVEGRFYKNFFFYMAGWVDERELKKKLCYKVTRYKRVGCEEYCAEKCADADYFERCTERCEERCVEEEWEPVLKVQEDVCLYKIEDGQVRVPRGLALRLTKNVAYVELPELDGFEGLRDYQAEVARSVWGQLRKVGAATVQMATGGGKSYMAGYLAAKLEKAGYNVVVTALQLDLVYQLRDFAAKFGARPVAVTVQTLWNRLKEAGLVKGDWLSDAEGEEAEILKAYSDESDDVHNIAELFTGRKVAVVFDEVHHLPARTVKTVAMLAGDGEALRIGLSATPWRNDGRDLEIYAYTGDVVEPKISSSYLIRRGFAVPVVIRVVDAPRCPEAVGVGRGVQGWVAERRALARCGARNKFIARLAAAVEKPALVITQLVSHAEELGRVMREAGLRVRVVTGAVKGETRREIYEELKSGLLDAVSSTFLADEGLDLPPLRTLIIAMGGKSKTRTLQRVGRLVRPWPGKTVAYAYELRDPGAEFSLSHLEERLALYETEPAWVIEEHAKF